MSSFKSYREFASRKFSDSYPKNIRVDSFRSDIDGRPIDEEMDYLNNNFTATEYKVESHIELMCLLEDVANPSVFKRVYEA